MVEYIIAFLIALIISVNSIKRIYDLKTKHKSAVAECKTCRKSGGKNNFYVASMEYMDENGLAQTIEVQYKKKPQTGMKYNIFIDENRTDLAFPEEDITINIIIIMAAIIGSIAYVFLTI